MSVIFHILLTFTCTHFLILARQNRETLFVYIIFVVCLLSANKAKVYYGLLKEPDLNILLDDEEEGGEGDEKPKVNMIEFENKLKNSTKRQYGHERTSQRNCVG